MRNPSPATQAGITRDTEPLGRRAATAEFTTVDNQSYTL